MNVEYECIFSILIENQSNLLTRRGFKIKSLAIESTKYDDISTIKIVLSGNLKIIDKVIRQLSKLLPVVKIYNLTNITVIRRKLLLSKIYINVQEQRSILEIEKVFQTNIRIILTKINKIKSKLYF